jgi:hypothetical protein
MAVASARHDKIMRSNIESAGGYVFKTAGAAFCAALATTRVAVKTAGKAARPAG